MNSFGKRIFILAGFGTGFALLVILVYVILPTRPKLVPQSRSTVAQKESQKNPVRDESFSLPPAPPAPPISPPAGVQEQKEPEASTPAAESQQSGLLEDLFASGMPDTSVTVDNEELEQLLRDYIKQNHPGLKLSDSDYERLAKSVKMFREANQKMRTMERVSSNSAAFKQSLQDMTTATKEFKQITGSSPGEFFMGEEPPVMFGNDATESDDDETEPEYLPDHKP